MMEHCSQAVRIGDHIEVTAQGSSHILHPATSIADAHIQLEETKRLSECTLIGMFTYRSTRHSSAVTLC
jgi:virulence-associated protein VagC